MISFDVSYSPKREVLYFSFFKWSHWSLKSKSNFPKMIQRRKASARSGCSPYLPLSSSDERGSSSVLGPWACCSLCLEYVFSTVYSWNPFFLRWDDTSSFRHQASKVPLCLFLFCFLCVFSWLENSFPLSPHGIIFYCMEVPVCLSNYILKDTFVSSTFLATVNKAAINICVQVSVWT